MSISIIDKSTIQTKNKFGKVINNFMVKSKNFEFLDSCARVRPQLLDFQAKKQKQNQQQSFFEYTQPHFKLPKHPPSSETHSRVELKLLQTFSKVSQNSSKDELAKPPIRQDISDYGGYFFSQRVKPVAATAATTPTQTFHLEKTTDNQLARRQSLTNIIPPYDKKTGFSSFQVSQSSSMFSSPQSQQMKDRVFPVTSYHLRGFSQSQIDNKKNKVSDSQKSPENIKKTEEHKQRKQKSSHLDEKHVLESRVWHEMNDYDKFKQHLQILKQLPNQVELLEDELNGIRLLNQQPVESSYQQFFAQISSCLTDFQSALNQSSQGTARTPNSSNNHRNQLSNQNSNYSNHNNMTPSHEGSSQFVPNSPNSQQYQNSNVLIPTNQIIKSNRDTIIEKRKSILVKTPHSKSSFFAQKQFQPRNSVRIDIPKSNIQLASPNKSSLGYFANPSSVQLPTSNSVSSIPNLTNSVQLPNIVNENAPQIHPNSSICLQNNNASQQHISSNNNGNNNNVHSNNNSNLNIKSTYEPNSVNTISKLKISLDQPASEQINNLDPTEPEPGETSVKIVYETPKSVPNNNHQSSRFTKRISKFGNFAASQAGFAASSQTINNNTNTQIHQMSQADQFKLQMIDSLLINISENFSFFLKQIHAKFDTKHYSFFCLLTEKRYKKATKVLKSLSRVLGFNDQIKEIIFEDDGKKLRKNYDFSSGFVAEALKISEAKGLKNNHEKSARIPIMTHTGVAQVPIEDAWQVYQGFQYFNQNLFSKIEAKFEMSERQKRCGIEKYIQDIKAKRSFQQNRPAATKRDLNELKVFDKNFSSLLEKSTYYQREQIVKRLTNEELSKGNFPFVGQLVRLRSSQIDKAQQIFRNQL